MNTQNALELELNDFNPGTRAAALTALCAGFRHAFPPENANVNMHIHSFFSYNAEGWSPSRIAWEAKKRGLHAAGLCDFDVLEGLEEYMAASHRVALRSAVSLETRAYLKEFADVDINSPGEPGVVYIMGAGFTRTPDPAGPEGQMLASFRDQYDKRNRAMIAKINAVLPAIALDYDGDAVPLTPSRGVTERHIISAYRKKSEAVFARRVEAVTFWSKVCGKDRLAVEALMGNVPAFEELIRACLTKSGGIGYAQPSASTFPPVDSFVAWVDACGAIPMIAWLDGTRGGESDPECLLECMCAKGAVALNIVPDRNWNLENPAERKIKVANLHAMVAAADRRDLPVNIGTEMNKLGLPFADDLDGEVLSGFKPVFLRGAHIMAGHTLLARYAGFAYTGAATAAQFKTAAAKNDFFARVGAAPALDEMAADALLEAGKERAFAMLADRGACHAG